MARPAGVIKYATQPRTCLVCGVTFASRGPENRVCNANHPTQYGYGAGVRVMRVVR